MNKQPIVVAVSGGVDSVMLLDMLVKKNEHELVVAHFDHGIRPDSAADARFVEGLAKLYDLPFVAKREELGAQASEEAARNRRYAFLWAEAKKRDAVIATAHHADDVVETIAINILRGTGWRGVAVLDSPGVVRPLLRLTKQTILDYALEHRLEWVEDSTNAEGAYLRNRVRRAIGRELSDAQKTEILKVWRRQLAAKTKIDAETNVFMSADATYSRYFFTQLDTSVACELLRGALVRVTNNGATGPQCERAVLAIKTARAGAAHDIGGGVSLRFTARTFIVETP